MSQPSLEERQRADRFKTAFNNIHEHMRNTLRSRNETFGVLIDEMLEKHLIRNSDYTFLDNCRELRNFLVHNKNLYMAIPGEHVVSRIEQLATKFVKEPTVYSEFATKVRTLKTSDTVYKTLEIIKKTGFTQFPVYDEDDQFINLLTEGILVEWMAMHLVDDQQSTPVDFRDILIEAITLHTRANHGEFVSRHTTVTNAIARFASNPTLSAVIVTENGKRSQTPLGIMTRSDALDMLDGKRDPQPVHDVD